ncbi:MAG: hypothetical protein UIH99_02430 [Alphaproteobacteria bacterium]|nr:hypothetical protein [Alphaproteobacteria bacterium]
MKTESGRSLIEVIGIMAITGVMTVTTLGVYNTIRKNQIRNIANAELKQIVENTKILMEARDSYEGLSVDYLIKAGALKTKSAPIGNDSWTISASTDGNTFSINLYGLDNGDCNFFATTKPKWVKTILINGFEVRDTDNCFKSETNQISFVAE